MRYLEVELLVEERYHCSVLGKQSGNIHARSLVEVGRSVVEVPRGDALIVVVTHHHVFREAGDLCLIQRIGSRLFDFGDVRIALDADCGQQTDETEHRVGIDIDFFHAGDFLTLRDDDVASIEEPRFHRVEDLRNRDLFLLRATATALLAVGGDVLRRREEALVMAIFTMLPNPTCIPF